MSTVGLNQKTIAKYMREQEDEDQVNDSMSKREYRVLLKSHTNQ